MVSLCFLWNIWILFVMLLGNGLPFVSLGIALTIFKGDFYRVTLCCFLFFFYKGRKLSSRTHLKKADAFFPFFFFKSFNCLLIMRSSDWKLPPVVSKLASGLTGVTGVVCVSVESKLITVAALSKNSGRGSEYGNYYEIKIRSLRTRWVHDLHIFLLLTATQSLHVHIDIGQDSGVIETLTQAQNGHASVHLESSTTTGYAIFLRYVSEIIFPSLIIYWMVPKYCSSARLSQVRQLILYPSRRMFGLILANPTVDSMAVVPICRSMSSTRA